MAEDEPRRPRRDEMLQNERLNLSREPLAAASSEVAEVTNLDRRVRIAEHMPLRADPLVFADDLGRQLDDLLVILVARTVLRRCNLLLGLILRWLGLFTFNLLDLILLDLILLELLHGLILLVDNRDHILLLLLLLRNRRLPFSPLRGLRPSRRRLRRSIA